MSTAGAIRERAAARRHWLDQALGQLQVIPAVVAVWLWGSGGRGDDDALSDWDIFVAWDDAADVGGLDAEWFRRFGEVLWWHEDPYNAPTEGRYVAAGYPAPYTLLPVDWYLQPASAAQIGTDTRILLERSPLPRVPAETYKLFPSVTHAVESVLPTDPGERVQHQLDWFWFMYAPMAKWAARGDQDLPVDSSRVWLECSARQPTWSARNPLPRVAATSSTLFGLWETPWPAFIQLSDRQALSHRQRSPSGCERTTKRTRSADKVGCTSDRSTRSVQPRRQVGCAVCSGYVW